MTKRIHKIIIINASGQIFRVIKKPIFGKITMSYRGERPVITKRDVFGSEEEVIVSRNDRVDVKYY